ncbi:tRNA pseudouridine(38-40) synthase TruA [Humibacter ginsenosidimutans]|uniref:tRNA pseudouridine(38-40) synthase TruA n=1 Tax=Humibacter ginsenosidimutans TaxID=2599293 RepID=UPI001FF00A05|nr:tRNA pseudouridine(38-40) synthase TruA [Humibacter ginsenosidimutans]
MTAETTDAAESPTRIRLGIAYDGTHFNGWARQPGLRTVQGVLEEALHTLFRRHEPAPTLTVAGRTDAGVHAIGQVAHVDLTAAQANSLLRPRKPRNAADDADAAAALRRRLTGILGPADSDVIVTGAQLAEPGFDARFSALWRRYEYRVADAAAPKNPLHRFSTVWHPTTLDVDAMDAAAGTLLGLHDFAAYCKPREGATTIRTLQEFGWARDGDGVLVARLQADAFCHSMVRALVGACVAVGEGRLDGDDLVLLRDVGTRTSAFKVMPAKGLTLMEVGYPHGAELAARAEQTRARRVL